jgi:catechol 2,3-dioxygenase-like lactoylglutathione lyase family enzyme
MKTHLNLATTDLPRSVSFYSTLLNTRPVKTLPDYALFITDRPSLELALDLRDRVHSANDVHYGIFVDTSDEVEGAIARLNGAGLAGTIEREDTCCYASQTKVWATDPEGRRWEVYTVHEETEMRDTPETACCSSDGVDQRSCCPV